jgi:hypothetical protein
MTKWLGESSGLILLENTEWPKSRYTEKKLNISITARPNGLIFLSIQEACSHSKSIRTRLARTFVKYHYWPKTRKFYLFTYREKTIYRMVQKSLNQKRKLNISIMEKTKRADFFTKDRGMFTLQIHTDEISGNLC